MKRDPHNNKEEPRMNMAQNIYIQKKERKKEISTQKHYITKTDKLHQIISSNRKFFFTFRCSEFRYYES